MQNIREFKSKMIYKKNLMVENIKTKNLTNLIPQIEENTVYTIITQKNINPYAFLLNSISQHGYIDNLYIATYRVSYKTATNFQHLLKEGLVKNFILVVNDNYEVLMKNKAGILVNLDKNNDNFRLIQRNSHAKVTLIQNSDEFLVISGSGNYSNNPKIEQYTIMKNKELYDFHKEWMLNG